MAIFLATSVALSLTIEASRGEHAVGLLVGECAATA